MIEAKFQAKSDTSLSILKSALCAKSTVAEGSEGVIQYEHSLGLGSNGKIGHGYFHRAIYRDAQSVIKLASHSAFKENLGATVLHSKGQKLLVMTTVPELQVLKQSSVAALCKHIHCEAFLSVPDVGCFRKNGATRLWIDGYFTLHNEADLEKVKSLTAKWNAAAAKDAGWLASIVAVNPKNKSHYRFVYEWSSADSYYKTWTSQTSNWKTLIGLFYQLKTLGTISDMVVSGASGHATDARVLTICQKVAGKPCKSYTHVNCP